MGWVKRRLNRVMVGVGLLVLLLGQPAWSRAQGPISIVTVVVTKVVKALDLEVQRLQTQTIWLQEAQKTVENAMSQVDLSEIEGWVQAQKDLYGEYFQELWRVKAAITTYDKVYQVINRQEQILSSYKQVYGLLQQDRHFTAAEVSYMGDVYAGIISESVKNLDQLGLVINSFATQMSDEKRMAIIGAASAGMDKDFNDLNRFNNQNALLSLQRAADEDDYELVKKLYGL